MSILGIILLVFLVLVILGAFPWGYAPYARTWGYAPGGFLVAILVIILVILLVTGRL